MNKLWPVGELVLCCSNALATQVLVECTLATQVLVECALATQVLVECALATQVLVESALATQVLVESAPSYKAMNVWSSQQEKVGSQLLSSLAPPLLAMLPSS